MTIRKPCKYDKPTLKSLRRHYGTNAAVEKRTGISRFIIYREIGYWTPFPRVKRLTTKDFEVTDPQPKPLEEHTAMELKRLWQKHGTKAKLCRAAGWRRSDFDSVFARKGVENSLRYAQPARADDRDLPWHCNKLDGMKSSRKMRLFREMGKDEFEALYREYGTAEALAARLAVNEKSVRKLLREYGIKPTRACLDETEAHWLVKQYQAGIPVKDICANLHVDRTTVYNYLKVRNVPLRRAM